MYLPGKCSKPPAPGLNAIKSRNTLCRTNADARIGFRPNVNAQSPAYSWRMSRPVNSITLPLEYAAQLVFELHSMRRECSEFASHLLSQQSVNERDLEECARLDDALARASQVLRHALDRIQLERGKRGQSKSNPSQRESDPPSPD